MRELETILRNIRLAARGAIDAVSGKVDGGVLGAQAELLKIWTFDFEKCYLAQVPKKQKNKDAIVVEGQKISEHGWFCCELLWNAEMEALAPQPTISRYVNLPSGVVFGEVKAQLDEELTNLVNMLNTYRRNVLQE